MSQSILSKSEADTIKAAQDLAGEIKARDIIFLEGSLGAGKTVFARALIRTLCGEDALEVISPTFTLVQSYEAAIGEIYHFDLYRIEDPEEIFELGWEDALAEGIAIVEWAERLGPYKPKPTLDIILSNSDNHKDHREILIKRV